MTDPATLEKPLGEATFCAVDVETSGLWMSSRLVEVAAVRFDLGGTAYEFQALVNPCERIHPQATEIHGITDDMVRSAPKAPDVLPGLLNFMRDCVFIAHNAGFDAGMIAGELERMGERPPGNPVVCTVRLARATIRGPESYRLESLVRHLGLDTGRLHNALPDARAAREVFLAGTRALPEGTTVGELPGLMGHFGSVAPGPLGEIESTGGVDELAALARARLDIEMDYYAASGPARGPVVVTPINVFEGGSKLYMTAYCHRDGIQKTYRVDRIAGFRRIR